MKIPLHNLFEEAWHISDITTSEKLDALIARLRKEGEQYKKDNPELVRNEMEARQFEQ